MALPYDIANGTDADAAQVMANFEYLLDLIGGVVGQPLIAGQAIAANTLVGLNNAGTVVAASDAGTAAVGFVSVAVVDGGTVNVIPAGPITGLSGLTLGDLLFLGPSGGVSSAPPAIGSGLYSQQVGWVVSTTSMYFQPQQMNGPL